jgi:hypothetical protein
MVCSLVPSPDPLGMRALRKAIPTVPHHLRSRFPWINATRFHRTGHLQMLSPDVFAPAQPAHMPLHSIIGFVT